jgi:arylamine N-acetyltransferase
MIDVEEVLAALGVARRPPDIHALVVLFEAFNRIVPFESASKIRRNAAVTVLADKPRLPEVFWSEHLELGTGGTCFARVAAFAGLAEALGFPSRKIVGSIGAPSSHAALLFSHDGKTWLVDVGSPLPEVRPLESGAYESALGPRARRRPSHATLSVVSGPDRGRSSNIGSPP